MKFHQYLRLIALVSICLMLVTWPAQAQGEETPASYVGIYRLVATGNAEISQRTGAVFSPWLELADMSLDGEFVAWTGAPDRVATIYTSDFAGGEVNAHPFDQPVRGFWQLVVGGRRVFALTSGAQAIWMVEQGGKQMILDATSEAIAKESGISQAGNLVASGDGAWVYFTAENGRVMGDVFRLPAAAGAPILVLARKDVPCPSHFHPERCDGGWGAPQWLDVSADAGRLAGVVGGFITFDQKNEVHTHDWDEVLVFSGAGKVLITSDDQLGKTKAALAISPDGSTVIFHATVYASPNDKTGEARWVAMDSDGVGAMRVLNPQSANVVRPAMNRDGTIALLDLSKLVRTDGSGEMDLFPSWNVTRISLGSHNNLAMSESGDRVAFTVQYPDFRSFYVGSVNEPGAEERAPIGITDVSLATASAADELTLTVSTFGPVKLVVVEPQRDGRLVDPKEAPWSCATPRDDGQPPDVAAQDGRFSAVCQLKGEDSGGMRVGIATEAQGWVLVKDYPLFW